MEKGGALYIEYTGNNPNEIYAVRVIGGSQYPVLDVTRAETAEERKELTDAYVAEMAEYVQKIEEMHNENSDSEDSHSAISGLDYDERNCILGATDIVLDQMMFSIPIKQVYKSIAGNGESQDEAAEKLYQSLMAMDEMIHLFYQHKGLNAAPVTGGKTYEKDKLPTTRLNIRYQRMFAGAFMYAGGLHIGIEWDSCALLGGSEPIQSDNGKYEAEATLDGELPMKSAISSTKARTLWLRSQITTIRSWLRQRIPTILCVSNMRTLTER